MSTTLVSNIPSSDKSKHDMLATMYKRWNLEAAVVGDGLDVTMVVRVSDDLKMHVYRKAIGL